MTILVPLFASAKYSNTRLILHHFKFQILLKWLVLPAVFLFLPLKKTCHSTDPSSCQGRVISNWTKKIKSFEASSLQKPVYVLLYTDSSGMCGTPAKLFLYNPLILLVASGHAYDGVDVDQHGTLTKSTAWIVALEFSCLSLPLVDFFSLWWP